MEVVEILLIPHLVASPWIFRKLREGWNGRNFHTQMGLQGTQKKKENVCHVAEIFPNFHMEAIKFIVFA